jgi:hypothetical protein
MSKKICKVKNVSHSDFLLTFEMIEKGKRFTLKPNASVAIDEDELNYLKNECEGCFKKGFLEIVDLDESVVADVPVTENKMTEEQMEEILSYPFPKLKSQINKIEVTHLLKELRIKAEEMNKSSKVIEIIDARIAEVADSLVL